LPIKNFKPVEADEHSATLIDNGDRENSGMANVLGVLNDAIWFNWSFCRDWATDKRAFERRRRRDCGNINFGLFGPCCFAVEMGKKQKRQ
jgi:hypothetical protein